jgi:hypothetical protein
VVLGRVKSLGLGIMGIEPWKDVNYYVVQTDERNTSDPTDSKWYMDFFEKFKKTGDSGPINFTASYYIPEKLMKE